MTDEQVKELLNRYDDLRELMVRMNADMSKISSVYTGLNAKADELDKRLNSVEQKAKEGKTYTAPKQVKAPETSDNLPPLKEFFKSKGLEVIDKRAAGGCLWIVGEQEDMQRAVDLAKKTYHISGTYGSGRATKQRPGWFTLSKK